MLARLLKPVLGVLLIVAVTINAANITGRFVFASSFIWAEEILILLNVSVVFIGLVVCASEGSHISVDIVRPLLPARFQPWFDRIADLSVALGCVGVLFGSWTVVSTTLRSGQKSIAAGYPMSLPHGLIAACLLVVLIVSVGRVITGRHSVPEVRSEERDRPQ